MTKREPKATAAFREGVCATLEAAGLPVRRGHAGKSMVTQRGMDACELRFRLARPEHLAPGEPWDADADAEALVTRALAALEPSYLVERTFTGRLTLLTVRARAAVGFGAAA